MRHTVLQNSFLKKTYLSRNIFNGCFCSLSQQTFRVQNQQKKRYKERFEICLNLTIKTTTLFEAILVFFVNLKHISNFVFVVDLQQVNVG